jgi:hypothetical protein
MPFPFRATTFFSALLISSTVHFAQGAGVSTAKSPKAEEPLFHPIPKVYRQGVAKAKRALRSGKLAYESFGWAFSLNEAEYEEVLKRYGVERRIVAFCFVNSEILAHAGGFNSVMMPAIERRFGKKFLQRAQIEAVLLWRKRNPGKSDGVNLDELRKG